MKLRYGSKTDIALIKPFLIKMWLMHDDKENIFNRKLIENTDLKKYFQDVSEGNGKSYLLIIEERGKLAGFCKINIEEIERFFAQVNVLYIDDVFVLDNFRRKGVADMLLSEAEKIAKEHNIKWMKARVYTFNKPAQELLSKNGFRNLYSEWFKTEL